jgi:SARP family transcriptional regulator, regulator of embCAB operon
VPFIDCRNVQAVAKDATTTGTQVRAQGREQCAFRISVLGGFRLTRQERDWSLPLGSERLAALLAVQRCSLRRAAAAGILWPEADEMRANASLRSALTRLRGAGCPFVEGRSSVLGLGKDVEVDLAGARRLAYRLLEGDMPDSDSSAGSIATLSADLLPGWYDDWVIVEAQEWHQLRLHALESLSASFSRSGVFVHAIAAAMAAVKGDPWRESARQALVKAHIAENNPSEAIREYERYRRLLHQELGLNPSLDFVRLMRSITSTGRSHGGRDTLGA